jgi:predicted RNA binding protein YcfA (HicA-like mRNA interferase family)
MKWSELRRMAEQNGWVLIRFGRKHDVYGKDGERLYVERHPSSEIKPGLYFDLLKKMKIQ